MPNETQSAAGLEVKPEHLIIFVNRREFTQKDGVKPEMSVGQIAALVGLTADDSVVRREIDGKPGEPLTGEVKIHNGDKFLVIKKKVEGGHDALPRVQAELGRLAQAQRCELVDGPPQGVIYFDLPVSPTGPTPKTDVFVPLPGGYPAVMLDHAYLPENSPLLGRVKGAVQETITIANRRWTKVSYHPHGNGGAGPWNPNLHGFHTYIDSLIAWVGTV